jgi:hypothetical protein
VFLAAYATFVLYTRKPLCIEAAGAADRPASTEDDDAHDASDDNMVYWMLAGCNTARVDCAAKGRYAKYAVFHGIFACYV